MCVSAGEYINEEVEELDRQPAGIHLRSHARREEEVAADRKGDERAGEDHKRLAVVGRLARDNRAGNEASARTRGDGVQRFQKVNQNCALHVSEFLCDLRDIVQHSKIQILQRYDSEVEETVGQSLGNQGQIGSRWQNERLSLEVVHRAVAHAGTSFGESGGHKHGNQFGEFGQLREQPQERTQPVRILQTRIVFRKHRLSLEQA